MTQGIGEWASNVWEELQTPMLSSAPADGGKSAVTHLTEVVKATPAVVANVARDTTTAVVGVLSNIVSIEQLKAAVKGETVAKGLFCAIAGTCILAGSAFMYRGFSQNCSFRNMIKTPISLIPKDEGVDNEQPSGPLGWATKIKSAAQRIALPAITGLGPILVGSFVLWNASSLAQLATGDS